MVLELLDRMTRVFKDYCGYLSEEALRKNFVLVYELIDEILVRAVPAHYLLGERLACPAARWQLAYLPLRRPASTAALPSAPARRTMATYKLPTAMRCACMCTLSQCLWQRLALARLAVSVARLRQLHPHTSRSP